MMMRSIEGGTSWEVPPAAAINAVAKGRGYLRFSISGSVTDPTAAVSALADPHIPEKNMVERIATIPMAPRILPMKSIARLTMRVAIRRDP